MNDNVILFPGMKNVSAVPQTIDEIVDKVTQTRQDHVDLVMVNVTSELVNIFGANGIDINDDKYLRDVAMVIESAKSLLYKQYDLEHPFHEMVDSIFEFDYNEDESVSYRYTLPTTNEDE